MTSELEYGLLLLFFALYRGRSSCFPKAKENLVNDCFITHAAKQFFVDVIEYYDHKCYVCSYAVKAKIRIVLLVNQNEDRNTTTQPLLGTNIILEQ